MMITLLYITTTGIKHYNGMHYAAIILHPFVFVPVSFNVVVTGMLGLITCLKQAG